MKTTITLFTLLLFACMMLPSCGVTIIKRQHNRGYYVSTNLRQHVGRGDAVAKTEESKPVASKPSTAEEAEELAVAETPATINEQPSVSDVKTVDRQTRSESSTADNDAAPGKSVGASSAERTFSLSSMAEKVPMMRKMTSTVKKIKSRSNSPTSDNGLSLIWILILVLVILWAIGLLGGGWGLGGLINLLLVIALILLILWLLRII